MAFTIFIGVATIGYYSLFESFNNSLEAATDVESENIDVVEITAENIFPEAEEVIETLIEEEEKTESTTNVSTTNRVQEIKAEMESLISKKSLENKEKNTNSEMSSDDNRFVPFYSQILDITAYEWKGVGCGIAGLAMLIDYYKPAVAVDTLLQQAIDSGAYNATNGWSHAGLISVAEGYGLTGETISLAHLSTDAAFNALEEVVSTGPVMVSVHYTFDPQNTIPHLAVVSSIKDGVVYYNDPASLSGGESISVNKFNLAWKKRYITIHA